MNRKERYSILVIGVADPEAVNRRGRELLGAADMVICEEALFPAVEPWMRAEVPRMGGLSAPGGAALGEELGRKPTVHVIASTDVLGELAKELATLMADGREIELIPGTDTDASSPRSRQVALIGRPEDAPSPEHLLLESGIRTGVWDWEAIESRAKRQEFVEGVGHVHEYDWLVFSCPRAVREFFRAFFLVFEDSRSLGNPRVAAADRITAEAVRHHRFAVDLRPETPGDAGLVQAFAGESIENLTVLHVRAEGHPRTVFEGLMKLGAIVDEWDLFPLPPDPINWLKKQGMAGEGILYFASRRATKNFFRLAPGWQPVGHLVGCEEGEIAHVLQEHAVKPDFVEPSSSLAEFLGSRSMARRGGRR